MTRTRINPNKGDYLAPPCPDISLAIVTHFTDDIYHRHREAVVDLCVETMRAGAAGHNYELLIWDNGSIPSFRCHLLQKYHPDVLVLAPNIGKASARRALAEIARGEIFGYCDDDIYFYPGWLDKQLEYLHHFPRPVMVSGQPQRTAFNFAMGAVKRFAYSHKATIHEGKLISEEDQRLFALGLGRPWETYKRQTVSMNDYLLEWDGMKAWMHGHHCQFITFREDIFPLMERSKLILDRERDWETKLDAAGYLRLTTFERSSFHVGNEIDGSTAIVDGKLIPTKDYE